MENIKICKHYKHPKICMNLNNCIEQSISQPHICCSKLYYSMGLEEENEKLRNLQDDLVAKIEELKLQLKTQDDKTIAVQFKQEEYEFFVSKCYNDCKNLLKKLKAKEQECEELKKDCPKRCKADKYKQAIESIEHILETYPVDDWNATREIENIIKSAKDGE